MELLFMMKMANKLRISSESELHFLQLAVDMAVSETLRFHPQNDVHRDSHFLANQVKNADLLSN
jgi:hypothetical protein